MSSLIISAHKELIQMMEIVHMASMFTLSLMKRGKSVQRVSRDKSHLELRSEFLQPLVLVLKNLLVLRNFEECTFSTPLHFNCC